MELTLLGKTLVREENTKDDAAEPGLVEVDSPLESIGLTSNPFALWKLYYHILQSAIDMQFAQL